MGNKSTSRSIPESTLSKKTSVQVVVEKDVPLYRIGGPTGSLGEVVLGTKTTLVVCDNGLLVCPMSFKEIYDLICPKLYPALPKYVKEFTLLNADIDYGKAIDSVVQKTMKMILALKEDEYEVEGQDEVDVTEDDL